jgi:hypothetical protein
MGLVESMSTKAIIVGGGACVNHPGRRLISSTPTYVSLRCLISETYIPIQIDHLGLFRRHF